MAEENIIKEYYSFEVLTKLSIPTKFTNHVRYYIPIQKCQTMNPFLSSSLRDRKCVIIQRLRDRNGFHSHHSVPDKPWKNSCHFVVSKKILILYNNLGRNIESTGSTSGSILVTLFGIHILSFILYIRLLYSL